MIVGLGAAVAGGFIFTGNIFARSVGIALAALSAIANFMWLPHYPIWAIVIIALDVLVIWALCTVDLGEPEAAPGPQEHRRPGSSAFEVRLVAG